MLLVLEIMLDTSITPSLGSLKLCACIYFLLKLQRWTNPFCTLTELVWKQARYLPCENPENPEVSRWSDKCHSMNGVVMHIVAAGSERHET